MCADLVLNSVFLEDVSRLEYSELLCPSGQCNPTCTYIRGMNGER